MLNLKTQEIYEENLVVEGHNYFVEPDFDLLNFGTKVEVSDDFLPLLDNSTFTIIEYS